MNVVKCIDVKLFRFTDGRLKECDSVNGQVEKNLSISILNDYYGALLTQKQREFLCLYYNEDFSLAEVADNYNISRQCVYDTIKNAESRLLDFESKIGFIKKIENVKSFLSIINHKVLSIEDENLKNFNSEEVSRLVSEVVDEIKKFMQGEC